MDICTPITWSTIDIACYLLLMALGMWQLFCWTIVFAEWAHKKIIKWVEGK